MSSAVELFGFDPAPGSPEAVRAVAADVRATAEMAHRARLALDSIASDVRSCGWEGDAADAFRDAFSAVPGDLGLMAESYDRVEGALRVFAGALERLQGAVDQALARARVARSREQAAAVQRAAAAARINALQAQLWRARQSELSYRAQAWAATGTPAAPAANESWRLARLRRDAVQRHHGDAAADHSRWQGEVDGAAAQLNGARREAESIRIEHTDAARRAADSIRAALAGELRNRGMAEKALNVVVGVPRAVAELVEDVKNRNFEAVVGKVREALEDVASTLEVLALMAAGIAALCMLSVVGAPFAAGLLTISAGLATTAGAVRLTKSSLTGVMAWKGWKTPAGESVGAKQVGWDLVQAGLAFVGGGSAKAGAKVAAKGAARISALRAQGAGAAARASARQAAKVIARDALFPGVSDTAGWAKRLASFRDARRLGGAWRGVHALGAADLPLKHAPVIANLPFVRLMPYNPVVVGAHAVVGVVDVAASIDDRAGQLDALVARPLIDRYTPRRPVVAPCYLPTPAAP